MHTKSTAIASLLTGAIIWGLIWYPYRVLEIAGLSGIHASVFSYLIAFCLGTVFLKDGLRGAKLEGRSVKMLMVIGLVAGGCNIAYVLAILHGYVMRVLLLFYLAPLWTIIWARILLAERVTLEGGLVILLSVAGATTMLWQPDKGVPWPGNGAEWLGLVAGILFALSNVLIKMTPELPIQVKSMTVFAGVVVVGSFLLLFERTNDVQSIIHMNGLHWGLLGIVGLVILVVNLVVQYGLTHTQANQAIVVFVLELVVAAVSSALLANETMELKEWIGSVMIIVATTLTEFLKMVSPTRNGKLSK